MKITEVAIYPVKPQEDPASGNRLVAIASFLYNGEAFVNSIGVYAVKGGGYKLSYPIKKIKDSRFDIFKPVTKELSSAINEAVISEYERMLSTDVTDLVEDEE